MLLVELRRLLRHPLRQFNRTRTTTRSLHRGCFQPLLEALETRWVPSIFTVTNLGDKGVGSGLEGDLRYAITQANANRDLSNRIQFQPGLTGTIVLTRGSLDITKN